MAKRGAAAVALLAVGLFLLTACGAGSSAGSRSFAFACPARTMSKPVLAERNTNPESKSVTVPKGADRLLLCRYGSRKDPPGPPVRERVIRDPKTIDQTAAALNGVPASNEDMLCLSSHEVTIYAVFGYPGADPVVVELRPYGCYDSTNGHVEGQYTVANGFSPMMKALDLPMQGA